jgi:hypothetical protein
MDHREITDLRHIDPNTLEITVLCRREHMAAIQARLPFAFDPEEVASGFQRLNTQVDRVAWIPEYATALNELGRAGMLVRWELHATSKDLPPTAFPLGRGQIGKRVPSLPSLPVLWSHAPLASDPPKDS